ncbi:hypothetical protein DL93DRAFT_482759 [Clavulina sp. PMI_390]|nr:hypothetical protein DL93DRAFT_482759 [Clavulina sp. PMI_390]
MSNSWRALARKCEDRIRGLRDDAWATILNLWYLRLQALAHMRLYNQATVECSNLWAVLESQDPIMDDADRDFDVFEHAVSFELLVFRARTSYYVKDPHDYLDQLVVLRDTCLIRAKDASRGPNGKEEVELWKERCARVGLLMASQLFEMLDFKGARRILHDLSTTNASGAPSAKLLSGLGRLQLEAGDTASANSYFQQSATLHDATDQSRGIDSALLAVARGEWTGAERLLRGVLKTYPDDVVAINALSVALLNLGKLDESVQVLESVLKTSPSTLVVAEPLVFNLATLYELKSSTAPAKKRELLIETAKWSGDGFRASALKLS